jgi:eukaryotic-like serine/threonine-protein kinase
MASLALALAGDLAQSKSLADDLARRFPENTLVQGNYLPTARAQLALDRKDASRAIQTLQAAVLYELGDMQRCNVAYPIYLRGVAYLNAHQGSKAAAEFQKVIDHPGIVLGDPIAALAHLGLARAYVAEGDAAKAKTAYMELFNIWNDADADVPVYQQARAEYARFP